MSDLGAVKTDGPPGPGWKPFHRLTRQQAITTCLALEAQRDHALASRDDARRIACSLEADLAAIFDAYDRWANRTGAELQHWQNLDQAIDAARQWDSTP